MIARVEANTDNVHDEELLKQAQRVEETVVRIRAERAKRMGKPFNRDEETRRVHADLLRDTQALLDEEAQKPNPLDRNADLSAGRDKYWTYDSDDMRGTDRARLDTANSMLRQEVITEHLIEQNTSGAGKPAKILSDKDIDARMQAEIGKTPKVKTLRYAPASPMLEMLNEPQEEKGRENPKAPRADGPLANLPGLEDARNAMQTALRDAENPERQEPAYRRKQASGKVRS